MSFKLILSRHPPPPLPFLGMYVLSALLFCLIFFYKACILDKYPHKPPPPPPVLHSDLGEKRNIRNKFGKKNILNKYFDITKDPPPPLDIFTIDLQKIF